MAQVRGVVGLVVAVKNRKAFIGKILRVDGVLVYFRDFDEGKAFLHKLDDAISMDERGARLLQLNPQIREVHCKSRNVMYVIDSNVFLNFAMRTSFGEGVQYYLPKREWEQRDVWYKAPFVERERFLTNKILQSKGK